jgi:hypothetical protein
LAGRWKGKQRNFKEGKKGRRLELLDMYVFVYVAMLLCLIGIYDQQACGGLGNAMEKGTLKENMNTKGVLTFSFDPLN